MTVILLFICIVPVVLYAMQSERWIRVWSNTSSVDITEKPDGPFLSVVVAYRNEEINLPKLLDSLKKQNYPNWELILVDDHSEDNSLNHCQKWIGQFPNEIRTLKNEGEGKKNALLTGVKQAKGELIVTTDADCVVEKDWLKSMAFFYQRYSPDLIIGPVRLLEENSFLSRFQLSEFIALQISGGAAALNKKAIMLNGANLACKRSVYLEANLVKNIASGDDMFLLEWAKKQQKKIAYLKSPKAFVYTPTEPTLSQLLRQKSRWAAKARHYSDKSILWSGFVVATTNLFQLFLLVIGFAYPQYSLFFLLAFIARVVADVRLMHSGSDFFTYTSCVRQLLVYQLIYPFYVLVVMLYPLFVPLQWKGRKIKT